jgi:hypothetical protein
MKSQIVLLGALLCLGSVAPAQTKSPATGDKPKQTESANREKRPTAGNAQSFTGCVDQQDGKYVLLDEQLRRFIALQTPGSDADSRFAKYLGQKVQVSGSQPAGEANTVNVEHISGIANMCGAGK